MLQDKKNKMIGSKKNLQSRKKKKEHVAKSEAFSMDPEFKFELDEKRHQPRNPRRKLKKKIFENQEEI